MDEKNVAETCAETANAAAKRGRRPRRRMTAAEFEAVRPLLKSMSMERIEAARLALVEGLTMQAVGATFGWTRQAANDAVAVVWKTAEQFRESQRVAARMTTVLPPGWEQVTLVAPRRLIAKFREELAGIDGVEEKESPSQ